MPSFASLAFSLASLAFPLAFHLSFRLSFRPHIPTATFPPYPTATFPPTPPYLTLPHPTSPYPPPSPPQHEIANAKEREINETRELYRPLSRLSASVYFAVAELSSVERM